MKIVHTHCAGLDVHKKQVTVCVLVGEAADEPARHLRTFRTVTESLESLAEWLSRLGVRQVAMESTGSYWKPVWAVLGGRFELLLVNPAHVKSVPGRKTDVKDAEWIADLHRHGLLRGSFVPPREIQDLRDLTHYRARLTEERSTASNRIGKVLETASASGRAMLAGLIGGEQTPEELAELARGQLRHKMPQLREALRGHVRPHHREMLGLLLDQWLYLTMQISKVDQAIQERMDPFQWAVSLLETIPGISKLAAWTILAETGVDMGQFPDEGHFASWAGLCPGNHESAGKRLSGATRDGNRWPAPSAVPRPGRRLLRALARRALPALLGAQARGAGLQGDSRTGGLRALRQAESPPLFDTRTPPRPSGVPFSRESRRGRLRVCATVWLPGSR